MNEVRAFANLVDLASSLLGGRAVGSSDEFFAGGENLLLPEPAVFDAARYTERGKWMDGWESRRKRVAGHDTCVIALGAPGRVHAFDIDTAHFVGNHPPFAAVDALRAPFDTPYTALERLPWRRLLSQVPLGPGCHNYFAVEPGDAVSHVRLAVFPDGGVARFRVFGKVEPTFEHIEHDGVSRAEVPQGLVDLGAVKNGGTALACSDARFGSMNQLLMPGRARTMGEGWETRRGRPPDHRHDWLIVELAARGALRVVEIDTNHYKGNFPEQASLEGIDAAGASATELFVNPGWRSLLGGTKLGPDARHFLRLDGAPPVTHVRLNIFPDGGVSRLRLWGEPLA